MGEYTGANDTTHKHYHHQQQQQILSVEWTRGVLIIQRRRWRMVSHDIRTPAPPPNGYFISGYSMYYYTTCAINN